VEKSDFLSEEGSGLTVFAAAVPTLGVKDILRERVAERLGRVAQVFDG